MSALRVPGPDGRIVLVPIDDGAVGRTSFTRYGTRGGTIYGSFVTGASDRSKANAAQREYMARMREMFPATTPKRQAQMAAYRERKR